MPPEAWLPDHSTQLTSLPTAPVVKASEFRRQVPAFLNAHQAGSVALAERMSTTISCPETTGIGSTSTNDNTSSSPPAFVSHAKFLFMSPPSSKQLSQRMFTPGGV